jgi:hypothetical protein
VRLNFNTEPTSTEEVAITRLEEKMDSVTLPRENLLSESEYEK